MDSYVIIASLKSESIGKLINGILGLCLLISCLAGSASGMHVKPLCWPRNSTSNFKVLPIKLDAKGHSPGILYHYINPFGIERQGYCT